MLRLHRVFFAAWLIAATTVSPIGFAREHEAETMIDHLLTINTLITERCGERLDVVWVDERGQNPPCTMAYSTSCTEIQIPDPQNCEVMMKAVQD